PGDFVTGKLREEQLFDLSSGTPWEIFQRNLTNSTLNGPPPSINDDHDYLWKFNFIQPSVKLFAMTRIGFANFTLQPEQVRNSFNFSIEIEISPYRTFRLDYQFPYTWREYDIIDNFFTCEARSDDDLRRDIEQPSNYMVMRTRASHN